MLVIWWYSPSGRPVSSEMVSNFTSWTKVYSLRAAAKAELLLAHLVDDLGDGDAGGGSGVERAEALGRLLGEERGCGEEGGEDECLRGHGLLLTG